MLTLKLQLSSLGIRVNIIGGKYGQETVSQRLVSDCLYAYAGI